MVLVETALCGALDTCTLTFFWSLASALGDCIALVLLLLLVSGYEWKLPIGVLINLGINEGLKQIFRVPRPVLGCGCGFAMPSGDAQFMGAFLIGFLYNDLTWTRPLGYRIWHALVAVVAVVLVCVGRVQVGFHTTVQVIVGVLIGMAVGVLYTLAIHYIERCCCPPRRNKVRV